MSPSTSPRNLRLQVTEQCNFRCRYCMPAGGIVLRDHSEMLPLEKLAELSRWLIQEANVRRIKLTGGEPLVRRGLVGLVRKLSTLPEIEEISATTNGVLLPELAAPLREAGLSRVNISVDTLNPERFAELTRGGHLEDTIAGLHAAREAGLDPVKINSVLLRTCWEDDVPQLLDLAAELELEIRFIELMRTGTESRWAEKELVEVDRVRSHLGLQGPIPDQAAHLGPARIENLRWKGAPIRVGWITPQSHPFCGSCTRLRMDARGRLRRCLMDPETLSLGLLRETFGSEEAGRQLQDYLVGKRFPHEMNSSLPMVSIGG